MTRLVAAELRKVWRSRFFLVALAALLGANLFLLWVGTKPASSAFTPAAYHAHCGHGYAADGRISARKPAPRRGHEPH